MGFSWGSRDDELLRRPRAPVLTPPELSVATIADELRGVYGLRVRQATFLPLGADLNAAVYRVEVEDAPDGSAYFLKLKRGAFNDLEVMLPAWLHGHATAAAMAALSTTSGALWSTGHGYTWMLYPYFAGEHAFHITLTDTQWVTLGATLRAIHSAALPSDLAARLRRDDYGPRDRDRVRVWDSRITPTTAYADPIAARLAGFWLARRETIRLVVARADELASSLRRRSPPRVLCHGDFPGANILFGARDALAIIDWDAAIFAPKERDLLFAGANISGHWDDAREVALFYRGYGATSPDPQVEAYYRYERIVVDIAEFAAELFGVVGSAENRERSYAHLTAQFAPQRDIALAHRAYARFGPP